MSTAQRPSPSESPDPDRDPDPKRGPDTKRGPEPGPAPTRNPNAVARELFDGLPDRYDLLAEVLSFGQNRRWRHAMVDGLLSVAPGARRVLDVATGTAGVALLLTDRGAGQVVGVDLTEQMLRRGRDQVRRRGRTNRIQLALSRAEQLPFPDGTFDALTFGYLLRYVVDPQAALRELARVVRPGGALASYEFFVPPAAAYRVAWRGYTRWVLPAAGYLTGGREWAEVGRFLGPSIEGHYERYPLDWTVHAWKAAGIEDVHAQPMSMGGGLVMWGRRADGDG